MSGTTGKQRVAVLGGGCAAMAAAWALTSQERWDENYEVTVYTLGWRLGGKGASGRKMDQSARIQEHGLHVWMGFYENAFKMIREVYGENGRTLDQPLATWEAAFTRLGAIANTEIVTHGADPHWTWWLINVPENEELPGEGTETPTVYDVVTLWWDVFTEFAEGKAPFELVNTITPGLDRKLDPMHGTSGGGSPKSERSLWELLGLKDIAVALQKVYEVHNKLGELRKKEETDSVGDDILNAIIELLDDIRAILREAFLPFLDDHDYLRTFLVFFELSLAGFIGIVRDRVFKYGWDAIDDHEFWAWMVINGINPDLRNDSAVRALYDFIFAYPEGNRDAGGVCSAAVMMRLVTRMWFNYRGAMFWKMNASMGDTIFGPIYEVLRKRGVKFEFFSKVRTMEPGEGGNSVGRIIIDRQVNTHGEYDPLVDVKGLPCWPSEPNWDQIKNGKAIARKLAREQLTLESAWCHQRVGAPIILEQGKDFDTVVLGIPVGTLRTIAQPLMAVDSAFRTMVGAMKTVETVACQYWLDPTLTSLGWPFSPAILTGGIEPYDTYADMAHLLPVENWTGAYVPQDVAYFCGVAECPEYAPLDDPDYPMVRDEQAFAMSAKRYHGNYVTYWPNAETEPQSTFLDWDYLHAPNGTVGEDRMRAQYWRANVSPDQRYTLALPGAIKRRMVTNETRFANLLLAGDWTLNSIEAGTVEGSVMSGLQAAREICGYPTEIFGETATVKERIAHGRTRTRFLPITAEQQIPSPFAVSGARLYTFVLEASAEGALQDYVDRTVNAAAHGAVVYEVLLNHVIAFMAPMERTWSAAPGLNAGWVPETDVGFWILVGRVENDEVVELLLYPVAMYVDQPYTQISGREVFGYPKGLGTPVVPQTPEDPGPFSISTTLARTYDINKPFIQGKVWEIERTGDSTLLGDFADVASLWLAIAGALFGPNRIAGINVLAELGSLYENPGKLPMVFLKQFRDAVDPDAACYQAVIENETKMSNFKGAGFMPGTYTFRTWPTESIGILEDLGLKEEMEVVLSTWSEMDMLVEQGLLRWESK